MCGKGNSNVICKKNGLLCKVPNKSPEENKKRRFLQSSRRWNKKHLGPFFYNITSQAVVGQIELHTTLGGVHKLREQGRGRGVVLKMFTLVHKGEEGGSANVHVGLNCKYFK